MKKKNYRILKWVSSVLAVILILIVSLFFWIKSLVPPRVIGLEESQVENLAYLTDTIPENRGKILAIVTSTSMMGQQNEKTGYELSELARAYCVFKANGFDVDIASPLGGKSPVIIDDEDMGPYDYAFLNDPEAQSKTSNTLKLETVIAENYEALFFVGGKGAMFDFPNNQKIQSLVRDYYQSNKVIGAVCHGPAALVNVTLDDGTSVLQNKTVSGFTNKEELLLIPDAKNLFPFLLQDKLIAAGARFNEGPMYLETMSHDTNLITGQNPWSVWVMAEAMIKQLGYTPKYRPITDEENAVKALMIYEEEGLNKAKEFIKETLQEKQEPISRLLIAKHSIMAAMQGKIAGFTNILSLASYTKTLEASS